MRTFSKTFVAIPLFAAALSIGAAVPASAQQQQQEGLVNVAVGDVNVQVPIGIAANVCGVQANVLATENRQDDPACTADAEAAANNQQFMRRAEQQGVAEQIRAQL